MLFSRKVLFRYVAWYMAFECNGVHDVEVEVEASSIIPQARRAREATWKSAIGLCMLFADTFSWLSYL